MRYALDTFSGARGWDVAAEPLGWKTHGVEIMPEARATAEANGFEHVGDDVREFHTHAGEYDLQISSPSCKPFTIAGKGEGRRSMDQLLRAVEVISGGERAGAVLSMVDSESSLVLEPLRLAFEGLPRALAWEQAASVLPIWQACAEALRGRGYAVWTSVVDAVDYGVPQNRKRAVLLARFDGAPVYQPPTALGMTIQREVGWPDGTYVVSNYGTGGDPKRRGIRYAASQPSATITSKADRMKVHFPDGTVRNLTLAEAATLQTFPEGYVFCGTKARRGEQIGNAVPPKLAHALLQPLL